MCVPLTVMLRDEGLPCKELAYEIRIGVGSTQNVVRNAEQYLGMSGALSTKQRNTIEKYLRTCVTAYAAAMDGKSVGSEQAAGAAEMATESEPADAADSGCDLWLARARLTGSWGGSGVIRQVGSTPQQAEDDVMRDCRIHAKAVREESEGTETASCEFIDVMCAP